MNWTKEQKSPNVHLVRIPYRRNGSWEQRVLLSSDRHHDNPHTDQALEKKHLDQALKLSAPIIDNGDLFCAMQGKFDKRSDKGSLRPEHQTGKYFDALVDTAAEFYSPYAKNIVMLGRGNHETAVSNRGETDLTARLAKALGCAASGYRGWVRFMFSQENSGTARSSLTLFHTHGAGGGGEVTRGSIKSARRAVYLPDADIVLSGHIHEAWVIEIPRFGLTDSHQVVHRTQYHVQCPTYKQEIGDGGSGWANEREMPPKPLGAWWMIFYWDSGINVRFERAS